MESVAISLIFSFVNPGHEKRVAEIVAEEMPGVQISKSHEVLPRSPEYDRTSTTVVNAYVGPRVTSYLERLVTSLKEAGYRNQLMVMQASGGVMTREYIEGSPIRVLASGPAGGVIGSAHVGVAKGHPNLLCVDMGGTSYDISMVLNGAAPAVAGWNMHHRYLVGVPMVQVETLGAGGGSICHVDNGELAGRPGLRGRGAGPDLLRARRHEADHHRCAADAGHPLGRLGICRRQLFAEQRRRRGGVQGAWRADGIRRRGSGVRLLAGGECQHVPGRAANHGRARVSTPRTWCMLAYGGNGPAFAAIQAEDLGIDKVLVPKASPTFSALGTLVADPSIDEERSYIAPADSIDAGKLKALWAELGERARKYFGDARFAADTVTARYQVNMRYPGQNWALSFDLKINRGLDDLSFVDQTIGQRAIALFNERHMQEYGHIREDEIPEITGVRLATSVATPSPVATRGFGAPTVLARVARTRRANLGHGYRETAVFLGADLEPGHEVVGPAIIEETFTTIVVYPGWKANVDDAGDYELTRV